MPGLLPDAELVALRQVAELSLDKPATVWRAVPTDDGMGHQTLGAPAQTTQPKAVFVRLAPLNRALFALMADRTGSLDIYQAWFSLDLDVREFDEIRVATGERYVVHAIDAPQSYDTLNGATVAKVR